MDVEMDADLSVLENMTEGSLIQRSVKERKIEYVPNASPLDAQVITFNIGGGDEFIALDETEVEVGIRILKEDGSNLTAADKVGCINYILQSLWKNIEVILNGTSISYNGSNQSLRAYLETVLSMETVATKSWLQSSGYHKDTAGKMDMADPNPTDSSTANKGLKERAEYTNESQLLVMRGKIHGDIFNQSKPLIDHVKMTLKFTRNSDSFILMSSMPNAKYKVKIEHMFVVVTKLIVEAKVENDVRNEVIPYSLTRVIQAEHTIPAGVTQHAVNELFHGDLPSKVVLCIVDHAALSGDYTKNPFNFQHFNISEISLKNSGALVDGRPLKFNFEKNKFLDGYWGMFRGLDKRFRSEGNDIQLRDYKNGFAIYVFDLSPSLSGGQYTDPKKDGRLTVHLQFARNTTKPLILCAYLQFDDKISINEGGKITTYFS